MAKQEYERIITPFGIAQWPALQTPDVYEGKASFKTGLILEDNEETDQFIEVLTEHYQSALEAGKQEVAESNANRKKGKKELEFIEGAPPYEPELDEDGNRTGRVIVRLRANAEFKDRNTQQLRSIRLDVVDGLKRPVTESVGGGSVIRCVADVIPYNMNPGVGASISLRLQAVQVKELRQGFSNAADAFGELEDGFVTAGASDAEAGDDY